MSEIKVTGTDSILIGMRLKDEMLNLGYHIMEQSDDLIVFEKQITDPKVATWHRDRYDMYPSSRVSYMLLEQDGTVRVVADLRIIVNSGSRFEYVADVAQHPDSTSIQEILWQVEHHLEYQERRDPQNTNGNAPLRQFK